MVVQCVVVVHDKNDVSYPGEQIIVNSSLVHIISIGACVSHENSEMLGFVVSYRLQ